MVLHLIIYSYSLSAGFALGLINLGRGNTISSNNDMRLEELEERMLIYINGGRQKSPIPKSRFNTGFEYKNSNVSFHLIQDIGE